MNELADIVVDKLLTAYIKQQATWYSTSTMDDLYHTLKRMSPKRKTKKQLNEADLLGELAKLMTKLDYHQSKEEYEICAEIKKQIDDVNDKLNKL